MLNDSSRRSRGGDQTMTKTESPTAPGPSKRSSGIWLGISTILVVLLSYVSGSVAGELYADIYTTVLQSAPAPLSDWLNNETLYQFLAALVVYGVMVVVIVIFIRQQRMTLRELGVTWPRLRDIGVTILAVPAYIGLYVVFLGLATSLVPGIDLDQKQQIGFDAHQNDTGILLTFLSLIIITPIAEEFIVRGFVFSSFIRRFKFWIAALLTSILFGAAHLQFGSDAPLLWVAAIDTFVLSLVLCYIRYKTSSLWPGILLHALKNFATFLVIFVFHKG
jgi:membrane protease YdiL (CAAX protease family)